MEQIRFSFWGHEWAKLGKPKGRLGKGNPLGSSFECCLCESANFWTVNENEKDNKLGVTLLTNPMWASEVGNVGKRVSHNPGFGQHLVCGCTKGPDRKPGPTSDPSGRKQITRSLFAEVKWGTWQKGAATEHIKMANSQPKRVSPIFEQCELPSFYR